MPIEERFVKVRVVDKREDRIGLLFRKRAYYVAFQVIDPAASHSPTAERRVSIDDYARMSVGDRVDLALYSPNQSEWYFTPEEAKRHR